MGKKYAIVGGKLIDGTGADPVENSLVLVDENGKIEYAGAHQDTPEGYEVIDATGKTVMPGLIDTHLHFSGNLTDDDTDWVMQPLLEKQAVAVKQAYDCLTHGLTTVCEIGRFGIQIRDCIDKGVFKGPRVLATGLGFCRTAGHGDSHHCSQLENKESHPWGDQVDGPWDLRKAVRRRLRENPDAGRLYLELGNIAYAERQYDRALACYRRGATVDPAHPSNYRSLALLYAISTEPVWTLVWGELFMNLERGSGRTSAMSETLAQTYRDNIRIEGDTAVRMTFSRNGRVAREGLRLRIPFGTAVFEVAARAALTADGIPDSLTLDVLSDMRERFVDRYFEKYDRMLFDDDAARPLMDYQRQVKEAGMMRPYNYWVLSQGFPDEFRQWRDEHAVQWQDFIAWFAAHPMSVPDPAAGRRNP